MLPARYPPSMERVCTKGRCQQPALFTLTYDYEDKLAVIEGQAPLFWRRRVAVEYAQNHGMTTTGRNAAARICAVVVKQYS